ncbi:hypothetical protein OPV22_012056 [Ensete ventricosum]|uniref:Uncharacterized protein n=1 Tax=Ensete ventricosum TaxID=4639 RepID=A0AAV8QW78_ENSVE|nr:hypothetical protein OPV22_012056 [Ensete ventricosum]
MGQALRRATGSVRAGRPDPPPPPVQRSPRPANVDPPHPPAASIDGQDPLGISGAEVTETIKDESGVIEERDPRYDEMLRHMVGKITSRSGGKLEMGEAGIVERYNRPMPKLRSSREEAGASGQKPLPPGTLSVEQVRQIILLHQGKAVEHPGPMDIQDIANKFGVDAAQVQQITRFMSLPPQDGERKTQ